MEEGFVAPTFDCTVADGDSDDVLVIEVIRGIEGRISMARDQIVQ